MLYFIKWYNVSIIINSLFDMCCVLTQKAYIHTYTHYVWIFKFFLFPVGLEEMVNLTETRWYQIAWPLKWSIWDVAVMITNDCDEAPIQGNENPSTRSETIQSFFSPEQTSILFLKSNNIRKNYNKYQTILSTMSTSL